MGAKSKRVRTIRTASEFSAAQLSRALRPPEPRGSVYAWSLAEIMSARDAQIRGQFALPAKAAVSIRTDDALAVARENRLAPQRCIKVEIVSAGSRGKLQADEGTALFGDEGVAISPGTRADINGCLVDHGVAFAHNTWKVRDDGNRTDVRTDYWPIEHVRWDVTKGCYVTRNNGDLTDIDIRHGDGRWIVFASHDHEPHKQSAALLAALIVWARHAYAIRDWSKASVAHGSAKVIGKMAEGVALQDANGITPEASAFAELLRAIATSDSAVGIAPAGSSVEFLTNPSSAWQVWTELVGNAEKAAARIYLGTDGVLGAQGGAPGVDISALFGVALTKVQGDLAAMTRGFQTGLIEPWTAMNWGTSELAPTRRYMIPDADADADRASLQTRRTAFFADIKAARENGFDITQDYVDEVAEQYDIEAPSLPVVAAPAAPPVAAPAPPPALRSVQ